jgi:hypothetical protein
MLASLDEYEASELVRRIDHACAKVGRDVRIPWDTAARMITELREIRFEAYRLIPRQHGRPIKRN